MKSVSAFCLLLLLCIAGAAPAGAAEPPADLKFSTYLGEPDGAPRFMAAAPSGSVFVAGWYGPRPPYYPYGRYGSYLKGFAPDGSLLFLTGFSSYGDVSRTIQGIAVSKGRVVVGLTDSEPMNWPFGHVA
jgi:hypothetical protein